MPDNALAHMKTHLDVFACPACGGALRIDENVRCAQCEAAYPVRDGVPHLFIPNDWTPGQADVTDSMQAFYSENPFPNYDGFETVGDLVKRAETGLFARLLNEQAPFNAKVLEVGCGTGQLTNYLGIAQRHVFGADMTLNSLALAERFRAANGLERVGFYQMNLFRPIFSPASFDLVICNGVLHHTSGPRAGFASIARLVKPGGCILIGLYNTWGRLFTDLRRVLFRLSGGRMRWLDPRLKASGTGDTKKAVWYADQYENPHESKHTMGELLRWFDEEGFTFLYGIPNPKAFAGFGSDVHLFEEHPRGTALDHFLVQLRFCVAGSREGGLYIMIGRKS